MLLAPHGTSSLSMAQLRRPSPWRAPSTLVDRVVVTPAESGFAIELIGAIAQMVKLSAGSDSLTKEPYLSSVKVVAGTRNHRQFTISVPI